MAHFIRPYVSQYLSLPGYCNCAWLNRYMCYYWWISFELSSQCWPIGHNIYLSDDLLGRHSYSFAVFQNLSVCIKVAAYLFGSAAIPVHPRLLCSPTAIRFSPAVRMRLHISLLLSTLTAVQAHCAYLPRQSLRIR